MGDKEELVRQHSCELKVQSSPDLTNLIISGTNYGIVPRFLAIPCDICNDVSGKLMLPFLEEGGMGNFYFSYLLRLKRFFEPFHSSHVPP